MGSGLVEHDLVEEHREEVAVASFQAAVGASSSLRKKNNMILRLTL